MRCGVRDVAKYDQLALHLGRHRRHFIAQTKINGHVRAPTPIVLNVTCQDCLAKTTPSYRAGNRGTQEERNVGQEIGEGVKGERTAGISTSPSKWPVNSVA